MVLILSFSGWLTFSFVSCDSKERIHNLLSRAFSRWKTVQKIWKQNSNWKHLFGANTQLMVRHLLVKQVDMLNTITMISFRFCPCQIVLSHRISDLYIFKTIVKMNPSFAWCWLRISGNNLLFCCINTLKTILRGLILHLVLLMNEQVN